MILDLARFVETERPQWTALEKTLDWLDSDPYRKISVADLERFHILYQRASARTWRKVATLESEGELRKYLEWLVSRAYAEIHETRERRKFRPWRWISVEFPRAFRRHIQAFQSGRGADGGRCGVRSAGVEDGRRSEVRHHAISGLAGVACGARRQGTAG